MAFVILAAILEGAVVGYWLFILEPKLQDEVNNYSHALSSAQASNLTFAIANYSGLKRQENLTLNMDKILLFRLPHSAQPFTKSITIEVDYEVIQDSNDTLNISRGEIDPENCIKIEIPLYHPTSKELLGIAIFNNNLEILNELENDVRTKLAMGSGLVIVLLFMVWYAVSHLNRQLQTYATDLARTKETTKKTIQSLQDVRIVLDSSGNITEVNPYTTILAKFNEGEMLAQHISKFTNQKSFFNGTHLKNFLKKKTLHNTEITFITKDKRQIPLMFSAGLVIDDDNQFAGIICIGKDITALKNAEKQLKEKQAQMAHAGRLSALGEMATGIAHEINQPLYIIRLAADCIKDYFTLKDPTTIEATDVDKIIAQVDRANTIIKNMRSFARADHGPMSAIDMVEPVGLALSFFWAQFRKNGITLEEEISPGLPEVKADPQKFEQIVVNFLSNARYAVLEKRKTGEKNYEPTVTVRLYKDNANNQVIFEVEDNGIGMTEEERVRCLEPFFTTKEVGKGTGLGLSIVYSLIREMNMDLVIGTTKEKGCLFRLFLQPINSN